MKIALIYFAFSSIWILASDSLINMVVEDPDTQQIFQTIKGWLFVVITSGLLYAIVQKLLSEMNQMHRTVDAHREETEDLLYAASHQMRSPLVTIAGFSRELIEIALRLGDSRTPPTPADTLDIQEASTQLKGGLQAAERILSFIGRLHRGLRSTPQPLEFDVLAELRRHIGELLPDMDRSVTWETPAKLHLLRADPTHFRTIVSEIIGNADKHGRNNDNSLHLTITIQARSSDIRILFRDHGPGIPITGMPYLFSPFRRKLSDSRGMGLALARRLAVANAGLLEVSNAADGGLVVQVDLPTPHRQIS